MFRKKDIACQIFFDDGFGRHNAKKVFMDGLEHITIDELSKEERLWVWMKRHGIPSTALARVMGVNKSTLCTWLQNKTMPVGAYVALKMLEIVPTELLPKPVYIMAKGENEEGFASELQRKVAGCTIVRAKDVFNPTSSHNSSKES